MLTTQESVPPETLKSTFDAQELKKRSVQGGLLVMGAQAAKFVIKFGSAIVVARLLTPADFGMVAMVSPILGFLSTFNDLGFGQAIVQSPDITKEQISALFWRNMLISAGLAILLSLIAPLASKLYHEPRTTPLLMAMGGMLILATLGLVPNALLKREMRFGPLSAIDVAGLLIGTGVTIAAAAKGFSYWSLVIGQVATSLAGLVLAFMYTRWIPTRTLKAEKLGAFMRFGANLTLVNVATYFSMTADNMIVGAVSGKVQLGLYDRSYTLTIGPLNQLLSPISQVSVPLLSRLQDKPELYKTSYKHMLRIALTLTMPAMLFCVMTAKHLVPLMLGPKWTLAAPIFAWVCFGGLIAPLFSSTGWIFSTQNRTDEQMKASVATAFISIISFAIGVHWGAVGVACVSSLSFTFIQMPLMLYVMTRKGVITLPDVVQTLIPFIITTLLVAIPLYWMRSAWTLPQMVGLLLLSYSLFVVLLMMLPGGRDFVKMLRNIRGTLRPS
ncbi:lipopolysaccharide biosynthesis protein [Granulicella tundricola]|uniref:Polysaccharide biosynthesis protein n=1 Tax=Granulicella tundricola (strain ATCC BAA-1859 / DSM 23138 / MP5ACTX9) TaxID=1198114 RepID=E8X7R2_GRATM|nr:lipopolysaccharide biosynthesis protein [Granulicella tundricola]ADW71496.1 polysaccharide biosynthesis protein [Granulicella tundricola MP5ACTX9]